MSTETKAKSILVSLFSNAQVVTEEFKIQLIEDFVTNVGPVNMSFQMSFNSLKQALQDNDANNSQLANIIMYATGCIACIKSCMFP